VLPPQVTRIRNVSNRRKWGGAGIVVYTEPYVTDADRGCESGIHNISFENGTTERALASTGGGSPESSVRGQHGYRDAVVRKIGIREPSRRSSSIDSRHRTERTPRGRAPTTNEGEIDEFVQPPQVTRIRNVSNNNNQRYSQTTFPNRSYRVERGDETVEYMNITRPAAISATNRQDREQRSQDKNKRNQQRAGHHRNKTRQNHSTTVRENVRQVEVGTRLFREALIPNHTQIVAASRKERESLESNKKERSNVRKEAEVVYDGQSREEETVRELLEQLKGGAHGYTPSTKEENIIRLGCENVNSLSIFDKKQTKRRKLINLHSRHQTDGACIVEHGTNFAHSDAQGDKGPEHIFSSMRGSRISVGFNRNENHSRSVPGGTMVATFSRLSSFVIDSGTDTTRLGRWSWILVGSGQHRTRIVSAYQPHKSPKKPRLVSKSGKMIGRGTVAAQHQRYFVGKGNLNDPKDIFREQLIIQLKQWRSANEEIILFADLNENIYSGPIAQALLHPKLLMEEQTLKSTGIRAPASHFTGTHPIVGTFATPGIVCTNSFLSAHGTGVGDHRFQLHDFDANSILGTEYPNTVRPSGRALRCDVPRIRKKYIKLLKKRLKRQAAQNRREVENIKRSSDGNVSRVCRTSP